MKSMNVHKVKAVITDPEAIDAVLNENKIEWNAVDVLNWQNDYPYAPKVRFRIAHTGDAFLLEFSVEETYTAAACGKDDGDIWKDSCVEFFSMPGDDDELYYNLECNCIGKLLLGCGAERNGRERAPKEITDQILRYSTLGDKPFEEKKGDNEWTVALKIPVSVFWHSNIKTLDDKTIRANFYKCGDDLTKPHFLSWSEIEAPNPDFHRPDWFGSLFLDKEAPDDK